MKNDELIKLTNPMEEKELEEILGGGDGIKNTITHECHVNSMFITAIFTCCK